MTFDEIEKAIVRQDKSPLSKLSTQPEQYCYYCLESLYRMYRAKELDREEASARKQGIRTAFEMAVQREEERMQFFRQQQEHVKLSGDLLTQLIKESGKANPYDLLLAAVKCLCLLRGEMVSYGLIEQKINERRQSDAKNTQEQTAGTGD